MAWHMYIGCHGLAMDMFGAWVSPQPVTVLTLLLSPPPTPVLLADYLSMFRLRSCLGMDTATAVLRICRFWFVHALVVGLRS